ncbi:MAG: NAD(P)/FAD-dependent oxidoreductase [Acidobacteriota bacterium]|nr:NAD(P)/FAD-dependent oxidoreductase [Acidobacteriota bacterium]
MKRDVATLIIGAGISGIGAGIELLARGDRSFVLLEAASELGGTWRDNTYPGVAVDIPSVSYCFSFETGYPWSREYATGTEIQRYVRHCAEKYAVAGHIRYRSRVVRSEFDGARDTWITHLNDGSVVTSRYVIAATGLFTQPALPDIAGLESFAGKTMHTARWDHGYDVRSKRVAVIGTGASAVQVVPEIAPLVTQLTVFQRTPIWIAPKLDRPLSGTRLSLRQFSLIRKILRLVSESGLEFLTFSIVNYRRFPFVVRLVQRGLRTLMRRQVNDRSTADELVPRYGLGCKRPAISNEYLPTFNRDNVRLVTQPIERICRDGIVTSDKTVHDVDTIILATGFLTTEQGNAPAFEVIGSDGVELGQFWTSHRRQAYAGVSVAGFPNFFLTAGPYSGGFNWFAMLEANLAHIMKCIAEANARGVSRVEVKADVHERYMRHMWQRGEGTVFKSPSCASAHSYYLDRHDDASLPLPHTPWWRAIRGRWKGTQGYRFGAPERGRA